jgi:acyl-CoA synthetase (NDP forming)
MTDLNISKRSYFTKGFVLEPDAVSHLKMYNIPYPEHEVAQSAEEAGAIAERLGCPVVLKVVSPDIPHKSDAGGVISGLKNPDQVKSGYNLILKRVKSVAPNAEIKGVMVCTQAPEGVEAILGAIDDSVFGPTIMFGLGGIFAEVLKDVTFRIAPLERIDAEEMIKEIKGYPILMGVRGQSALDINQLIELIMSVSRMVIEQPAIKELDLNPVRLYEHGLMALDVRMVRTDT